MPSRLGISAECRTFRKIEYPPLAYEVMTVPRWLDEKRISPAEAKKLNKTIDWDELFAIYERPFRMLMGLAEGLGFVLFALTLARRRPDLLTVGIWGYVVSTTLLAHVLYSRLDAGLLALIMLWAYAWTRARQDGAVVWTSLAYLAVGLGISYKLVPVVMLPFLLLADWRVTGSRTSWRGLVRPLSYLGFGVLFPYLPLLRSSGSSAAGLAPLPRRARDRNRVDLRHGHDGHGPLGPSNAGHS